MATINSLPAENPGEFLLLPQDIALDKRALLIPRPGIKGNPFTEIKTLRCVSVDSEGNTEWAGVGPTEYSFSVSELTRYGDVVPGDLYTTVYLQTSTRDLMNWDLFPRVLQEARSRFASGQKPAPNEVLLLPEDHYEGARVTVLRKRPLGESFVYRTFECCLPPSGDIPSIWRETPAWLADRDYSIHELSQIGDVIPSEVFDEARSEGDMPYSTPAARRDEVLQKARERMDTPDTSVDTSAAAEYDSINPSHYRGFSNGAEVIDITENLSFNRGNAVKYLARAGSKPGQDEIQDLKKARWYVTREIARLGAETEENDR